MFRMAVGHSDDIDLDTSIAVVLQQCDAGLAGAPAKAGLVMSAWEVDHGRLLEAITAHYPGIELAGASAAGEMSSVLGFQEDSITLAVFAADSVDITAGLGRALSTDQGKAVREAVAQARGKTAQTPRLCIALPAIGVVDATSVLRAMAAELGPDVPVLGGGAAPQDPAADPTATASLQLSGSEVATDAISILLFSGPLDYSFGVETGWRGVGPRARVTGVSPVAVTEIDGQPAMAFYDRYLSTDRPPIANPMAVFEDPTSELFYLRTPTGFDRASGSVSFFGAVPLGATVQITVAATDEIFGGTTGSVSDALAAFPSGRKPEAALIYSCATRRYLLGSRAGHEIELVRDLVGQDVPVAGFYCMGEIAPTTPAQPSRFHNATIVSLLLGG